MIDGDGEPMHSDRKAPEGGRLKHGNANGNWWKAPRCGAYARRTGRPCQNACMKGRRRCRMHGGVVKWRLDV